MPCFLFCKERRESGEISTEWGPGALDTCGLTRTARFDHDPPQVCFLLEKRTKSRIWSGHLKAVEGHCRSPWLQTFTTMTPIYMVHLVLVRKKQKSDPRKAGARGLARQVRPQHTGAPPRLASVYAHNPSHPPLPLWQHGDSWLCPADSRARHLCSSLILSAGQSTL